MEQTQTLKLNVNNIHKFLVGSNKQLSKLKKEKQNLLFRYEKQAQRRQKESKIEARDFGIGGGIKRVASAVSKPATSFFDRIKEFFGIVLLGLLVNNLPKIFAQLKEFFNSDFIKGLSSFLSTIGKGFMTFVDIALSLPKSVMNVFDNTKKSLENQLQNIGGALDSAFRFVAGFFDNDNDEDSESLQGTVESYTLRSTSGGSATPIQTIPYSGLNMNMGGNSFLPTSPVPGYREGGVVGGGNNVRGGGGFFGEFNDTVNTFSRVSDSRERTSKEIKYISDNIDFLKVFGISKSGTPSTKSTKISKSFYSSSSSFYGSTASGVSVDATGEPGGDFTPAGANNRAVFAGEVVEIKHQYNPNKRGGDGEMGSGYGNYIVVRSKDPKTGQEFDALYAHFPSNGINVKEGQRVNVGDVLGRMGTKADPRSEVGSLTGPHTSLDFYKVGSNERYPGWRNLVNKIDPTFGSVKPVKKAQKSSGGGNRYNTSSGSGSVFIYAIQPQVEYVPMPYPVPVRQPSMTQNTQPPKPSALWRA